MILPPSFQHLHQDSALVKVTMGRSRHTVNQRIGVTLFFHEKSSGILDLVVLARLRISGKAFLAQNPMVSESNPQLFSLCMTGRQSF
jgi:hypothetical protein